MLVLAVLNTAPVAVCHALFVFRRKPFDGPGHGRASAHCVFSCSGTSAPMWTFLADRFGAKRVLLLSMLAAIFVFLNAFPLNWPNLTICGHLCRKRCDAWSRLGTSSGNFCAAFGKNWRAGRSGLWVLEFCVQSIAGIGGGNRIAAC